MSLDQAEDDLLGLLGSAELEEREALVEESSLVGRVQL